MTVLFRSEAVSKDTRQIFRFDPHAVIPYRDGDISPGCAAHMDFQELFDGCLFVHGVFGVAEKIDENLQYLVTINQYRQHAFIELLDNPDAMTFKCRSIYI